MDNKRKTLASLLALTQMSLMCNDVNVMNIDNIPLRRKDPQPLKKHIPNGCQLFNIQGVEIVAINKKSAIKKFNKMKR